MPAAKFGSYLQTERAAAVVYLFEPSAANLAAYQAAISAHRQAKPAFAAAMTSHGHRRAARHRPGPRRSADPVGGLSQLPTLRGGVRRGPSPRWTRWALYSQGIAAERQSVPDPDQERDRPPTS